MPRLGRYAWEHALVVATMLLTVTGFWNIYLGERASAEPHHHLHVATVSAWLLLLRRQLGLAGSGSFAAHARLGTAILAIGPVLVASVAMLSVHSAAKGVAEGKGDFLLVQNVGTTLVLGLLIVLAFILRKRRKLHGNLLMSTAVLFFGIATFFTLISFVPGFVVTGPETFHRFRTAATAGKAITLVVSVLYFARDRRNGWPFLLAGGSFVLNDLVLGLLIGGDVLVPVTAAIGGLGKGLTFATTSAAMLALLLATGVRPPGRRTDVGAVEVAAD